MGLPALTWVTISGSTVSWYTTDLTISSGSYTVPITINYASTPTLSYSTSFAITFSSCTASFTVASPTNQNYITAGASSSQTISAVDSSGCGYTPTCSLESSAPSWVSIDASTCVVSWYTSDATIAAGVYPVPISIAYASLPTSTTLTTSFSITLSGCTSSFTVSTPVD